MMSILKTLIGLLKDRYPILESLERPIRPSRAFKDPTACTLYLRRKHKARTISTTVMILVQDGGTLTITPTCEFIGEHAWNRQIDLNHPDSIQTFLEIASNLINRHTSTY